MNDTTITRELVAREGQYAVTRLVGATDGTGTHPKSSFELVVRGHTALKLHEVTQNHSTHHPTDTELEPVTLVFDGSRAVKDIGVELLRASHVVIPLEGIVFAEDTTNSTYATSRWIENPLNDTPEYNNSVTYPKSPAKTTQ